MFKKPQKKAFRRKQKEADSDEESTDRLNLEKPAVKEEPEEDVQIVSAPSDAVGSAVAASTTLISKLSFEYDSGDTEEFRIKKSNRSRRIAKQLKEEIQAGPSDKTVKHERASGDNELQSQRYEKSTVKRESPEIFVEAEDEEGDRAATQKLIADAKKRREEARKAREQENEYIALDDTERFVDSKSRLIREDENDFSDEDAEVVMSSTSADLTGARGKEAEIRRRNREMFERDELIGEVLEDSDEETQRWEEAQLRKGVTLPQIQAFTEDIKKPVAEEEEYGYYDPNAYVAWSEPQQNPGVNAVEEIRKKIKNRMESAKDLQRRHQQQMDKLSVDLKDCTDAINSLDNELATVSFEYKFYQEMRGFVWDVIDCYNDKLPKIITIEEKAMGAWKRGASASRDLRQQYVRDLSDEIHGKHSIDILPNVKEINDRRGRLADYRERKRKLALSAGVKEDDMDLDEYEPRSNHFPPSVVQILAEKEGIFEDTVDDFRSLPKLLSRFGKWRTSCGNSYNDAYIAHCFPKLAAPLVRFNLLEWNPLKESLTPLTEMKWVQDILLHAFVPTDNGSVQPQDADIRIIPMLIEDVVFSRLLAWLDVWDPLSRMQSERLTTFLRETLLHFPLVAVNRKPVQDLFRGIVTRLTKAIEDDVFLPVYSQRILDADPEARYFVSSQFDFGLKLFSCICLFHGILSNAVLVELCIEKLLNRNLLVPLRTSHNRSENVKRCKSIFERIPENGLADFPSTTVPKHFEMFCHVMVNLGKQNDNRADVRTLSEILQKLKDFKGAETLERQLAENG
ncbi:PAX3- and PAX7-binding protein 1-like isoform X2 [Paramacrobiotus metropolitanus]|uniref:PAX3- and PAX7-binding protein 1-like isoform X2 n=1 Tax=Paramacrobiotus metropolitanus TaxID=2943436 RepID=UPI002445BD37|nr:PAX3- and PAX7-binding protein 1-like isoform X2 [Paramacrobiotus metropolitanus]